MLAEMASLDVLTYVPEPLRALYSALECELHPLDMIDFVAPTLESWTIQRLTRRWQKSQPALAKYSQPLREGILFRVVRQLQTVYSAMKLDGLYHLMDALELDRFAAERRLMEASACGQLRVRMDKAARVVLFEENKTECDVLSSYLNALGAAWAR